MPADDATIGIAEFVNVLKQTEIRGGAAVGQADVRLRQTGFENTGVIARCAFSRREGEVLCFTESTRHSALSFPSRPLLNPRTTC